jgi:hypothetical protein
MLFAGVDAYDIPVPIRSSALPRLWTQPVPEVTTSSCPTGWVCHCVRLPAEKCTCSTSTREGADGAAKAS